jgi:hypothetical protein
VLTPAEPASNDLVEISRVERQNQVGAYFSGATVKATEVKAPPPAMSGGSKKKEKRNGC